MSDAVKPGCAGKNQGKATTFSKCWRPYRSECTGEIVQNLYRRARDSTLPLIDGVEIGTLVELAQ